MTKISKRLALQIAAEFLGGSAPPVTWTVDEVRDHCDLSTGSDLDCTQLDLLTDWVTAALDATKERA